MKSRLTYIPVLGVVLLLAWIVAAAAFPQFDISVSNQANLPAPSDIEKTVAELDYFFEKQWKDEKFQAAGPAPELAVLRRLSLALHGTIPSLEEIRRFESDKRENRLEHWCREMLEDSRFGDYFAERIARSYVGTQLEPFIVYRRDRFTSWIADQFRKNRPYDEFVREMISEQGLWTGKPATNFITHSVMEEVPTPNKLAGRTVRAVLGQRMDCAQCHDHPFADWKQDEFEGLAAYFGQVKLSPFGVEDDLNKKYEIEDRETLEKREITSSVPFGQQWLPKEGTEREKLAHWCTHPENRRFARATVNRIWALMFGKAYSEGAPYFTPVDDLPDPETELSDTNKTVLDILADDFVKNGYNIKRLIEIIAASKTFRLDSRHETEDSDLLRNMIDHWAVFPLIRLRPEQVVGSMLQAASIKTVDQNSNLLTRTIKLVRESEFIDEYGDVGDEELDERAGTVPQALLRMNGQLAKDMTNPSPFNATPRIAIASSSPEKMLENSYLTCLSRRPTQQEQQYFLNLWAEENKKNSSQKTYDLHWVLFNTPEFSWNH